MIQFVTLSIYRNFNNHLSIKHLCVLHLAENETCAGFQGSG